MKTTRTEDVQALIEALRHDEDHKIALPKGVAVGLLVGIEDALSDIRYLKTRMRTMKDFRKLDSMEYALTGPRDRLIRVITGVFP